MMNKFNPDTSDDFWSKKGAKTFFDNKWKVFPDNFFPKPGEVLSVPFSPIYPLAKFSPRNHLRLSN